MGVFNLREIDLFLRAKIESKRKEEPKPIYLKSSDRFEQVS